MTRVTEDQSQIGKRETHVKARARRARALFEPYIVSTCLDFTRVPDDNCYQH